MTKVLFILKYRDNKYACDYNDYSTTPSTGGVLSSGLMNSARFVSDMLNDLGHDSDLVQVVDNNGIDREVTKYKPDVVIIEAYWVVPEKFEILTRLHPTVTWIVRNHSAMPFASTESIILDWSLRYMNYPKVVVACNDPRTDREFRDLISVYKPEWTREEINDRCVLLTNYYPSNFTCHTPKQSSEYIDISCFGAIRPLKNHLIQAVASIQYAESIGKKLRFHINATRIEGRGDSILLNLRRLFNLLPHELIEHPWMNHETFLEVIRDMDVGLQVSYTETFNIVAADMVMNDIPVVVSNEIRWVNSMFYADPNDSESIVYAIKRARFFAKYLPFWKPNVSGLERYNYSSIERWNGYMNELGC